MNPTELYDDLAISFPPMWPLNPTWTWVNLHDGRAPKIDVISELLEHVVGSSEVIVLVHSQPGVATRVAKEAGAEYVAKFLLKHDIQVSDPEFNRFVSVSSNGMATSDA